MVFCHAGKHSSEMMACIDVRSLAGEEGTACWWRRGDLCRRGRTLANGRAVLVKSVTS